MYLRVGPGVGPHLFADGDTLRDLADHLYDVADQVDAYVPPGQQSLLV